ncbi:MAG: helix-turn-helix transcriptional regulator [Solirubrobacteraceae bacterium]|nr:helix-turn-helix transcriptional regulator [Solirubrobacteraceae bacterium]
MDISTRESDQEWTVGSSADLGRAIAGVRAVHGLTQEELAERTGIQRSYLAKLEAGASVLLLERALRALRRMGATVTVTLPADREPRD